MRRFVFKSLLRKLPLFAVLTVVLTSIAIFTASSLNFHGYESGYIEQGDVSTGYIPMMVVFFIVMLVLPLFSMNYRFSLARSDAYRQAAFKDKSIRHAEHLSTLVTILIGFTFAYFVLVGLLAIRNAAATLPNNLPEGSTLTIIHLHYIYYVPLYFVIILFGVAQYFISYLFVSRCNCLRNAVITLIMGQFVLLSFTNLILLYLDNELVIYPIFTRYTGASIGLPIALIIEMFNRTILFNKPLFQNIREEVLTTDSYFSIIASIIIVVIYFSVAILGLIAFLVEKDPSGEFAGKSITKKPYQEIIFHAGFALFGAFLGSAMLLMDLLSYFLFLVIFAAAYYPLYGTLLRNFKLKPYQIAIMAGVVMFIIVVSISVKSINSYYYN